MGKLQVFEVVFEGSNEVFKPGDTIQGHARIVLTGEKGDIRGIKVICKGKSYTHWTETRGSGDHRRTIHYTWKIPFFKQEVILRGAGKNNQAASRMKLPMGDHRFPFQFQLPREALPPPFEGTWGWVRYYIKATIDRPWKFDHKVQRFFSIWTTKDLNLLPNILTSPVGITEKTVCCLCCESGPINVRGSIDKGGYAPGENILVTVELNNQCGRELVSLKAALIQKSRYHAKHGGSTHTRKNTKKICEISFDDCNAQESMVFERRPMAIPPIAPNSFENCPNIEVMYHVKIEADVSGTPIDATVELPIVIGTVPALPHLVQQAQTGYQAQPGYQTQPGYQAQPSYPAQLGYQAQPGYPPQGGYTQPQPPQPGYPPQSGGYPPPQAGYPPQPAGGASVPPAQFGYPPDQGASQYPPQSPVLPPPSYEMAVEGPIQIEGKKGNFGTTSYAPRYPYYNPGSISPPVPSQDPNAPVTTQPQFSQQPAQAEEILVKFNP